MSDAPEESQIPKGERDILVICVYEALDLAKAGQSYDGWRCLLGGEARAMEAVEDGEPWGAELLRLYRRALEHYGEEYGVRPE